jgi:hypothetical protein
MQVQQVAAKVGEELGLTPEEVLAEAHALLQELDHGQP